MRRKQQGMTFLGLLILVVFVGLFVYAGIRLTPAYLDYMQVTKALNDIASETDGKVDERSLRIALQRRWDIEDFKNIDARDVEVVRDGDVYTLTADYQVVTPFVANIELLVSFNKSVEVPAR